MNLKVCIKRVKILILMLAAFAVMAGPSFAATYDLRAGTTTVSMPDFPAIPMWGLALVQYDIGAGFVPGDDIVRVPGPILEVPPGDTTLTVNLTNNLPDPVSIVIPGQPSTGAPVVVGVRVRSFTHETAGNGGTGTYTWNNLKSGTYLYHSGTHPAKQVQMGLYGTVTVGNYAGVNNEVILLYSEIDLTLHNAVAADAYGPGLAVTSTLNYKPEYFLINGEPYPNAAPILDHSIVTNENVLIRFLNAGLKTHVPTLLGGYMSVIAEDGNLYPYQKEQYSVSLPAGKTVDALWVPATDGTYPVYDARHHLTTGGFPDGGMLVKLEVGPDGNAPVANNDAYTTDEQTPFTVAAPGVLDNDTTAVGGPLPAATAILVDGPAGAILTLNADGSFNYNPAPDFFGTDVFTYKANDGTLDSNVATVTITVSGTNDPPVANDDTASTVLETAVNIAVLANDNDVDGDTLTVTNLTVPTNGAVTNNGTDVTYTPDTGFTGTDSFTYKAQDTGSLLSNIATVTITVVSAANQPPVAKNDTATTKKNTAVDINVIANDYDPDGFIFPGSVVIVSPPANGTVVNNANGTVTYTPAKNYTGDDSFTYIVYDNDGASSIEAPVSVLVTKK